MGFHAATTVKDRAGHTYVCLCDESDSFVWCQRYGATLGAVTVELLSVKLLRSITLASFAPRIQQLAATVRLYPQAMQATLAEAQLGVIAESEACADAFARQVDAVWALLGPQDGVDLTEAVRAAIPTQEPQPRVGDSGALTTTADVVEALDQLEERVESRLRPPETAVSAVGDLTFDEALAQLGASVHDQRLAHEAQLTARLDALEGLHGGAAMPAMADLTESLVQLEDRVGAQILALGARFAARLDALNHSTPSVPLMPLMLEGADADVVRAALDAAPEDDEVADDALGQLIAVCEAFIMDAEAGWHDVAQAGASRRAYRWAAERMRDDLADWRDVVGVPVPSPSDRFAGADVDTLRELSSWLRNNLTGLITFAEFSAQQAHRRAPPEQRSAVSARDCGAAMLRRGIGAVEAAAEAITNPAGARQ